MVRRSATLLLFTLGIAWDFGPAGADPIPESLRIQREAEKAYQQNRVVPIDRPNAHHRDRLMPENASPPSGNGVGSHGPPQSNNAPPSTVDHDEVAARLKAAYPDFVVGLEGNDVVFKDGTRLPFDDGKAKTFEEWLGDPDIRTCFGFPTLGALRPRRQRGTSIQDACTTLTFLRRSTAIAASRNSRNR